MTIRARNNPSSDTFFLIVVLLVSFLTPVTRSSLRAEDNPNRAGKMLEGLKQRSARERWQRVKKQYPSDTAASRTNAPSQLPAEYHENIAEDDFPPAPQSGLMIPRLSAIPRDPSTDWVLPARDPATDIATEPATASPNAARLFNASSHGKQAINEPAEATRIASQDSGYKTGFEKKSTSRPRSPLERTIGEIVPFYDRDRDNDIREFAVQKGKEFDIGITTSTWTDRSFPEIALAWEATNFYHNPLYFSDPALERYGHSYHPIVQPFASIARLGVQFAFLPYQMTIDPPCKEEYALGWYRPGECAPMLHYPVPLNAEAAVVEAAAITGLIFIIP